MWSYSPIKTIFVLAPMVFSFALALDIYMPVIPEMAKLLCTNESLIQLTLSLFFLTTGLGQLLLGPISDHFGRYKVLLSSAILFMLFSFLCAQANDIYLLIIFRISQAIGACGLFVTSFAIVRDAYSDKTSAMIYSLLNAMISISPIIGPIIGVFIITFFPWRAIFYFLSFLGFVTLFISIFLCQESLVRSRRKRLNLQVFKRYSQIAKSLTFWAYTMPALAGVSAFFTLFSMTPYIIQTLNQTKDQISIFFGMAGAAFLIGAFVASAIIHKLGIYITALFGAICILLSAILLITIHMLFGGLSLWGFFGPSFLATFGSALSTGSGASGALEPFSEYSGAASAMFGACEMSGASIIGSIVMLFHITNSLPLAFTMLATSVISIILLVVNSRRV